MGPLIVIIKGLDCMAIIKRIFFTAFFIFVISGCVTSNKQPLTSVRLPLDGSFLALDVENDDQILAGDFFLLKSGKEYISLQRADTREEFKLWGISTVDYLNQLYGEASPDIKDIAMAKNALSNSILESKLLTHKNYFAVYHRESDNRERIFFTDKLKQSKIYYILETRGKDALKIFYGEN